MTAALRDRAWRHIPRFEGSVTHMYLDTKGIVTVGVGCVVGNEEMAVSLPFIDTGYGFRTKLQVRGDYWALRACPGPFEHRHANFYRNVTKGRLKEDAIRELFSKRVADFVRQLTNAVPEFPSFPESAQLALLDLAFNMGVWALTKPGGFPKLMTACRAKDWAEAARQCHRDGVQPTRNTETTALFEEAV